MRFVIRFCVAVGCFLVGILAGVLWLNRGDAQQGFFWGWAFWIAVYGGLFAFLLFILPFTFSDRAFILWRWYISIPVGFVVGSFSGLVLMKAMSDSMLLPPAMIVSTVTFAAAAGAESIWRARL
jgi:hypothetical protein